MHLTGIVRFGFSTFFVVIIVGRISACSKHDRWLQGRLFAWVDVVCCLSHITSSSAESTASRPGFTERSID